MTNKDFKYPPLNERELGLLLRFQKTTPEISKVSRTLYKTNLHRRKKEAINETTVV